MRRDDHPLVTAARFATPSEAHLARSFLEAEGIPALVLEQDGLRLDPFRSGPPAGVRLQVRAEDLAAARELLEAGGARDEPFGGEG